MYIKENKVVNFARTSANLYIRNWKWFWTTAIALLVAFLTYYNIVKVDPSEQLIKDTHPTRIIISEVKLMKFLGTDEPYVVLVIKNDSRVTASNISVSFFSDSKEVFITTDEIRKHWFPKGLAIKSQKEAIVPVAKISDYKKVLFHNSNDIKLLKFKTLSEKEDSENIDKEICGAHPERIHCNYEIVEYPTDVKISYESIFNEKLSTLSHWYNVLLIGQPEVILKKICWP